MKRFVIAGLLGALATAGAGWIVELWRFGPTDDTAYERVRTRVHDRFVAMAAGLQETAARLTSRPEVTSGTSGDAEAARALFGLVSDVARDTGDSPDLAITVYGANGAPYAWTGRPSEIPRDRILGPATFFIAPGSLGLRLVYVEPLFAPEAAAGANPRRIGSIAAERVLSPSRGLISELQEDFTLSTSIAAVALRTRYQGAGEQVQPHSFLLEAPPGNVLLEGHVDLAVLTAARAAWRRGIVSVALAVFCLGLLFAMGPVLERLAALPPPGRYLRWLAVALGLLLLVRLLLWVATAAAPEGQSIFSFAPYAPAQSEGLLRSPLDLLLTSLVVAAVVGLGFQAVERARVAVRDRRASARAALGRFVLAGVVAGIVVATLFLHYERLLGDVVATTGIDVLRTSLHPWDPARLAVVASLTILHAAVFWVAAAVFGVALVPWRLRTGDAVVGTAIVVASLAPATLVAAVADVPRAPYLALTAGSLAAMVAIRRWRGAFRHASYVSRLTTLLAAFLVPGWLAYPSLVHFADRATRRLIEDRYAQQAAEHPQALQDTLYRTLEQIDRLPAIRPVEPVDPQRPGASPDTDQAFFIWRQTDLARARLTSAIELYGPSDSLISRFAFNIPEYASAAQTLHVAACDWEVFAFVAPFGSQGRRVLHAERAFCDGTQPAGDAGAHARAGAIVVHVALDDYQGLPFISSKSPYFELLQPDPDRPREGVPGEDVELVIYGWSLMPFFLSGSDAWPIDAALFERLYASRDPFWTTLRKSGTDYQVYIVNNRAGIYALGYPRLRTFNHLVHGAEIATLTGLLFVIAVVGSGLFDRLARHRQPVGRALLREIRTSFYRRLFLAFVAVAIVPLLALAFAIRNYFTAQLAADFEAGAARTAAVAQRVIEESAAFEVGGDAATVAINDDVLIWISQVIDQHVNIFDGPQLVATSERDLFASGLLPVRTPDVVYEAIALERLPAFVGEDLIGPLPYVVAATPVRAGGRAAILTLPLASRQQQTERQTDDFDRGILLGTMLFILVGAAIGLYMAERIADPVKRLTRATRLIARGDFDARVAVRSADELQRLVDAFNRMAAELKEQRQRLERTNRLEAWAEMARQVAHEIKNPLTPVQLSAEHLLRVHADQGRPLSPVLESCVDSILKQVRILRQIASEFSSYASAPVAHPLPTALPEVVDEVLEPYRVGLKDRIAVQVDLPDTLPPLSIDRVLVGRALTNVIENALQAMPGGGSLSISASAVADGIQLVVADTGVGVDPATLARIFEPYFSTKASGTGLGMAIAKRNIELNGGTIEVESEKGRGTKVTIAFKDLRI